MPRGSPRREEEAEVFDVENGRQEDERLGKLGILALCLLVCISPLDILLSCLAFIAIPSLAIAFTTIGFVYLQDCELEPMIPMWLVIQGLLMLFGFVVERSSRYFQAKTPRSASSSFCTSFASSSPPVRVFSIILTLVSIAWLTAGNLWVFGAFRQRANASDGAEESCDPVVYIISYIAVLASDVAFVLFPLLLLVPLLRSRLCCPTRRIKQGYGDEHGGNEHCANSASGGRSQTSFPDHVRPFNIDTLHPRPRVP